MFYRVYSIWEQFRLGKAIRITDKDIPFGSFRVCIASGAFQKHFKFRAFFGCFELCFTVIAVLDHGDFSFLDRFVRVKRRRKIKLCRIELRFRADMQRFCIEQVPLARLDLPQRPVVSADIGFCGELPIAVGFVHIHELPALIDTVLGTN